VLKSEMLRFRGKGGGVLLPAFVNEKNKELVERAETAIGLFESGVGRTRRELEELTDQFRKGQGDQKLNRGLVEVLMGRCRLEAPTDLPAADIRTALFELGAKAFPVGVSAEDAVRDEILSDVAARFGITVRDLERCMFSDLKEEQVVESFETTVPSELLQDYNVALAQGVLLHATSLTVVLPAPDAQKVRQLFRFLKFFRLLFTIERFDDCLALKLDGPLSVLSETKSYGVRLASFLPSLLRAETFTLAADIKYKRRRYSFTLSQDSGLKPRGRDLGTWVPPEMQQLIDRIRQLCPAGIRVAETAAVFSLNGRDVYVPDLAFLRGSRTAYLEVIWPWRKVRWHHYFPLFQEAAPQTALLLVSAKSAGKTALEGVRDPRVIPFRVTPLADKVVSEVQRLLDQE